MGQKINPNIFRLGVNKKWKTEFFEKKRHELPIYTFKDLEIKSYIERFLETQGIILHDYKQHYSNSTLTLYISYFVSSDFVMDKKVKTNKITLINQSGSTKTMADVKTVNRAVTESSQKYLFKAQTPKDYYSIKKYLSS